MLYNDGASPVWKLLAGGPPVRSIHQTTIEPLDGGERIGGLTEGFDDCQIWVRLLVFNDVDTRLFDCSQAVWGVHSDILRQRYLDS